MDERWMSSLETCPGYKQKVYIQLACVTLLAALATWVWSNGLPINRANTWHEVAPLDLLNGSRVDTNSAPSSVLEALPGIGPTISARIIATREELGGFCLASELTRVRGLGKKKLRDVKALLEVGVPLDNARCDGLESSHDLSGP